MRFRLVHKLLFFATLLTFLSRFAVGQPESNTRLDLKTLTALLGKGRNSPEVERLKKMLSEKPEEASFEFDKVHFYMWKSKGLSLRFNSEKLTGVLMYAGEIDGFKPYDGELPAKLSFADTRATVEEKLGKPEVSGGGGRIPFWVVYKSQGVSIDYIAKDPDDQKNRIRIVGLMPVNKKGK